MAITSVFESNIVVNTIEGSDTLDDILDFVSDSGRIDSWETRQVLWDVTLFDFPSIDSASVRSFVSRGTSLAAQEQRSGLKTAILVNSDLGFGMMRMLQILAEEHFKFELRVFRDRDLAVKWLEESQAIS